jgi:LmbE family N-acetylglucosaminyl deacetylase
MTEETSKRMGRPPEGSGKKGEPERIRDYPKLLVTIRPVVRNKLKAIAAVETRPAWQIVEDAIAKYFEHLPPERRRSVQAAMRRDARG